MTKMTRKSQTCGRCENSANEKRGRMSESAAIEYWRALLNNSECFALALFRSVEFIHKVFITELSLSIERRDEKKKSLMLV